MNSPSTARRFPISAGAIMLACVLAAPVSGQWLNYPTPGIPRTPDGKPRLTSPAPKRPPDGKHRAASCPQSQSVFTGYHGPDFAMRGRDWFADRRQKLKRCQRNAAGQPKPMSQ